LERHRLAVLATDMTAQKLEVFTHHAAAALLGIPIIGEWPQKIDVLTSLSATGGRSEGLLRRRRSSASATAVITIDGVLATSPAQTVVDLSCSGEFMSSVASMDRVRRSDGPLCSDLEIEQVLGMAGHRVGHAKARRAFAFSSSLARSVLESGSRVTIHRLGYPPPVLQEHFIIDGAEFDVDFWWPRHRIIGEADGAEKYLNPTMLDGRSPGQVVLAEKWREDALRRESNGFGRWGWPDGLSTVRLARILDATGLPR
jgi:hypothetical protein